MTNPTKSTKAPSVDQIEDIERAMLEYAEGKKPTYHTVYAAWRSLKAMGCDPGSGNEARMAKALRSLAGGEPDA